MKNKTKKEKIISKECSLCTAKFEVWLNNSKMGEERKEKISGHFLSYCPSCGRASEK